MFLLLGQHEPDQGHAVRVERRLVAHVAVVWNQELVVIWTPKLY
jgi:hypothetical protein